MEKIKKIVFTGDIFRPDNNCEPHQNKNISWLYHYFMPNIKALLPNIPIEILMWDGVEFNPSLFYSDMGLPITSTSWAKIYSFDEQSKILNEIIEKYFIDSFVVGFEMPPLLTKALTDAGMSYLNLEISPYRFLDDLCLEVTTNHKKLEVLLNKKSLSKESIYCCSGRIMAHVSRFEPLLSESTALIVGQTLGDKSLIRNGRFLSLHDFVCEIESITKEYDQVLYKRHPYDNNSFMDENILSDLGIRIVDGNVYQYFSQNYLQRVVGISSSCLYESPFFDTNSTFLGDKRELGTVLFECFNSILFWSSVLEVLGIYHSEKEFNEIQSSPNTLRNSLDVWWGVDHDGGAIGMMNRDRNASKLEDMRNTISWKITAPLRWFGNRFVS